MDMDSARVSRDLPTVSGRIALLGSFISQLVAFCLLYFAPVLADEQDAPGPVPAIAAPRGGETLDPKHEKDHVQDRASDRGRAHLGNP
jgi:hypothetical protein